jgi:hypothetical protein
MTPTNADEASSANEATAPGALARERRTAPLRSLELDITGRGLRAALDEIDLGLEDDLEGRTRREVRLVIGELAARWLEHRGAAEPIMLDLWLLSDRIRLEVAALGVDPGPEFWSGLCRSLKARLKHPAMPDRRRGAGAFIEVPRAS